MRSPGVYWASLYGPVPAAFSPLLNSAVVGVSPMPSQPSRLKVMSAGVVRSRDDADRGQLGRQQRVGAVGLDDHGLRVGRLHAGDRLGVDREGRGAVRDQRHAAHGVDHVLGVELGAVVEPDALAQLELPGGVVEGLPALGEVGLELLLGVLLDQRLEDVRAHRVVRAEVVVVGVHRARLRRETDGQLVGGSRPHRCGRQNQRRCANRRPQARHDHAPSIVP